MVTSPTLRVNLETRLSQAAKRKGELEYEITAKQEELKKLDEYVRTLTRFLELEDELSSGITDSSRVNTVTEALIFLGFHRPNYTMTVKEGISHVVDRGLYSDEKGAADSVYTILAHRNDLFERIESATYKLKDKAVELAKTIMQPKLPGISKTLANNIRGKHNQISAFVLSALSERPHSLEEIKMKAQERGFRFPGKKPGRVIHFVLMALTQHKLVERVNDMWQLKQKISS